jgi:hypothetical protein
LFGTATTKPMTVGTESPSRTKDRFGNLRLFATGAITLNIEGFGDIRGENPFALTGGVGGGLGKD